MANCRTLLITIFAIAGLALVSPRAFAALKEAGKITRIKGEVRIDDANGNVVASTKPSANRRHLKEGSPFYVGEIIKTFGDARVKLEFVQGGPSGNNSVVLGADTRLAIEDVSEKDGKKKTTLQLYEGQVRNDVKAKYEGSNADKYEVKTQNAVAGVRGTTFLVQFAKGQTTVGVAEGRVNFRSATNGVMGASAEIGRGNFAAVAQGAQNAPRVEPLANNPTIAASIEALDPNAKERMPAAEGGPNKPEGPKGEGKTDSKAGPGGGDGADAKGAKPGEAPKPGREGESAEAKPAAPLYREGERKGDERAPATVNGQRPPPPPADGGKIFGIGDNNKPGGTLGAGPMPALGPNPLTGILDRTGDAISNVDRGTQTEQIATSVRGKVCVRLSATATCP